MINDYKPKWVVEKITKEVKDLEKSKINKKNVNLTFCGITFKQDTDDLRESPSVWIVNRISEVLSVNINIIDPNIQQLTDNLREKGIALTSIENGLLYTDILVILVPHKQFFEIPKDTLSKLKVIDICGYFVNRNKLINN